MATRETTSLKREFYLASLERALKNDRVALVLGGKKTGKTTLLKQFLAADSSQQFLYLDLSRVSLSPEQFAVEVMLAARRAIFKTADQREVLPAASTLLASKEGLGEEEARLIDAVDNELQKIKPDHRLLVTSAFRFIRILCSSSGKRAILALDNAEHLLDLNNFSGVGDVVAILHQELPSFPLILSSSLLMRSRKSFSRLKPEEITLEPFSKEETRQLSAGLGAIPEKDLATVYGFTRGHPFVTSCLLQEWETRKSAEENILAGLLVQGRRPYLYCESVLQDYYAHARGQTLLRNLLKIVAEEDLRLSEIARKLYRSAPVTKSLLERLMAVDAVKKEGKTFSLTDPVLARWIVLTSKGYDFHAPPDKKILKEVEKEFR